MKNIFLLADTQETIDRIDKLTPDTKGLWGKMTVAQMLAHCNVSYEFVYDNKHAKPGPFKRFLLKVFVKNAVIGDKPYKRNLPTAPEFLQKEEKNFEKERSRLIDYLRKTQILGEVHFDGKDSQSFGNLSKSQWNTMFYKHLDHHLTQFGV
jgi:hypothetical protein